ncbi:Arm DNA-binding domain-containing protein [Janthinobacterium tructae]|uniref:Arm DNA-binding domain-containing protein n=1 Tax=Janthinobacterium tructae TaxID=2590869 RepID=UPI00249A491B|nr:Arm DNA-binding domain-containing protein [Janthinobacterium tructae]MDI3292292.1 Arm DNA-binding domain-containing protein [Janthinobacterium tructae]
MPKRIAPLTEQQLIQAVPGDKPCKLFDGYGLYPDVMPTGAKIWRMRFHLEDGRENALTFGHYPAVSLALARCRRSVARQMLHDGLDPRTEFDAVHMRLPKPVRRHRLLPVAMDDRKVGRSAS